MSNSFYGGKTIFLPVKVFDKSEPSIVDLNPQIELQTLQPQRSRIISLSSKQTVRHREHILEFVFPFFSFFSQFQTKFSIFSVRLKIKGKMNEKNTGRKAQLRYSKHGLTPRFIGAWRSYLLQIFRL